MASLCLFLATGCTSPSPGKERSGQPPAQLNTSAPPEPISPVESHPSSPPPRISGNIDSLHLFTVPIALSFDSDPSPDGFDIRVYASNDKNPKGLAITQGSLEVLMFDGLIRKSDGTQNKPSHIWRFTNAQLKANQAKTSIGFGYRFRLRWGDNKPESRSVTVVAKYQSTGGGAIYSAPSTIAVSTE